MFRYYLRLGLLSIRANPALSALMVAAIAIGIGACMTIANVRHVMSDNPIAHKNDVLFHVQVDNWSPDEPYEEPNEPPEQLTYLDAKALHDAGRAFRQVVSFKSDRVVQPAGEDARPFQETVRATTADFFAMFDVPFAFGSGWDQSSDLSEERVVVLSSSMNDELFGGEDSVGELLRMNDETYRVVGVLAPWTPVPKFYDVNNNPYEEPERIFLPFSLAISGEFGSNGNTSCWKPSDGGYEAFLASECIWMQMWVELDGEQEVADYFAFLDAYAAGQKELGRFPRPLNNRLSDVMTHLANQNVVDDSVRILLVLAVLFLVVCLLNTVGLLLAKVLRRSGDIGLRRALGASKKSVFAQYIVEAGVIGLCGGVAGIALTWLGLTGVRNLYTGQDFVQKLVRMDWIMILTAVAIAVFSALCAALYPTWRAIRVHPAGQLKTL